MVGSRVRYRINVMIQRKKSHKLLWILVLDSILPRASGHEMTPDREILSLIRSQYYKHGLPICASFLASSRCYLFIITFISLAQSSLSCFKIHYQNHYQSCVSLDTHFQRKNHRKNLQHTHLLDYSTKLQLSLIELRKHPAT